MTQICDQILDHLERERLAITGGAFQTLPGLGADKETLFRKLETHRPQPEELVLIRRKAARNLDLLTAALRGVKDATDRIDALKLVQRGFDTYGADGQRQAHLSGKPAFEHKA